MSTAVSIAIILACVCIIALTIVAIFASLHLRKRLDAIESKVETLNTEVTELVREARVALAHSTKVLIKVEAQMEDMEYVSRTTRGWVAKADSVLGGVGKVAEPALFLFSKKMRFLRAFAGGVLQAFTNHKVQ